MTRKRKRLTLVLGGMASLGVAAALVFSAMSDNLVFFVSPSDIALKPPVPGRALLIGGLVKADSVVKFEGGKRMEFKVTDGKYDIPVSYTGVPPSLFREGQGVVAEGKVDGTGMFQAATIMAKHDERYMPAEVVEALKKSGQWREDPAASADTLSALASPK